MVWKFQGNPRENPGSSCFQRKEKEEKAKLKIKKSWLEWLKLGKCPIVHSKN